jgi:tRNA(adenine34) deaminase
MCAGAIVNARIPRVVFGASDAKCGACGSVCDIFSMEFNHHPTVTKGIREEEAAALMEEFFRKLRVELRSRPKWKRPEQQ